MKLDQEKSIIVFYMVLRCNVNRATLEWYICVVNTNDYKEATEFLCLGLSQSPILSEGSPSSLLAYMGWAEKVRRGQGILHRPQRKRKTVELMALFCHF